MKATPEEYDFHCRILARNDPTAFATFAEGVYHSLVQRVQRRAGPHADAVLVEEMVGQALLDYHDAPERYDPNRTSLHSYLAIVAHGDVQNAQKKERSASHRLVSLSNLTLQEQDIEDITASPEAIEGQMREQGLWDTIDTTFPDPLERQVVLLMLNNVRPTRPYARLLGLSELPQLEQRKRVYRIKERIAKRLRRTIAHQLDV